MQHEGSAILLRQAVELFVQEGPQVPPVELGHRFRGRGLNQIGTARSRPEPIPGLEGDPVGDPEQPAAQGIPPADGGGFAEEHQEGRLERILRLVPIVQDAPAGAQDHGAVPPDDGFKGRFILEMDETLEELPIPEVGRAATRAQQAPDQGVKGMRCHDVPALYY